MSFTLDLTDLYRMERRIAEAPDQIRFAAARSLNDAADKTIERLAGETWPSHVKARNPNFMKAALTTRGERASKNALVVTVYDRLNRASLKLHDKGGLKRPRKSMLAIPSPAVPRAANGAVPRAWRPANLRNKVVIGNKIFQSRGRGKNKQLVLMYTLRSGAPIKADVPLANDFDKFMREEMAKSFPRRFSEALAGRKTRA